MSSLTIATLGLLSIPASSSGAGINIDLLSNNINLIMKESIEIKINEKNTIDVTIQSLEIDISDIVEMDL